MVPFAARRATCLSALVATVLAGCQAAPGVTPGTFLAFGAAATEPATQPVAIAAQPAAPQAPAAPVVMPTAAPLVPTTSAGSSGGAGGGSAPAAPAPTGRVIVDLSALSPTAPAAQRRVLSTVADIDRLEITVAMPGVPDKVLAVTATEMAAGKKSVTFEAMPTGMCTITIKAFDASNAQIGVSSRTAPIVTAKETKADLYTWIVPDPDDGYTYGNRNLAFGVNLQAAPPAQAADGSGPVAGTVIDTFTVPQLMGGPPFIQRNAAMYADNAGHLYVRSANLLSTGNLGAWWSTVTEVSTTDGAFGRGFQVSGGLPFLAGTAYDPVRKTMLIGTGRVIAANLPKTADFIDGALANALSVDATGDAYYVVAGKVYKRTAGVPTLMGVEALSALEVDTAGQVWVNQANNGPKAASTEVRKYAPDGSLLATFATPIPAVRLINDGLGGMWVCDRPGGQIAHIAADGTVGPALGIAANDMCVDAKHHAWVASTANVLQLDADGVELGRFPLKASSIAAGDGFVFARTDLMQVLKIQP